jgi:hypothetical protein
MKIYQSRRIIPALFVALVIWVLPSRATQAPGDECEKKKFTQIDVPGAVFTIANAINPRGDIVGFYVDSSNSTHGFLVSKGKFTTIDVPGANLTVAFRINPDGGIVGAYRTSNGSIHGFC